MDINQYFNNRRTIRKYTDRIITDELLKKIIDEASHAPTTGNMQLYSVIITRDNEMKKKLAPMHFNQPVVESCDVLLTFCLDFNRFVQWCKVSNAEPGYDNFQSFVTAFLDTAIFAQQFCTIAEMNGMGCCYLGTTTYNAPQIAKLLELPDLVVPVTTITMGYPADDGVDVGRLPVEAIIHNERYRDYGVSEIKNIFSEKESREDSIQFIKENKKQNLAQVFTDVRYTKEDNELFSKVYFDFIKSKGYGMPLK